MLRAFNKDTGIELHYNAWYKRLQKEGFPNFMQQVYFHILTNLYTDHFPDKQVLLGQFSDIFMQDGSSYGVNKLMSAYYPGRFTNTSPAAVELHVFYSLRHASILCAHLAPDSVSEYDFMPTANSAHLANTLSLFDRGYGSLERLHVLEQEKGYFICRMKDCITPCILAAYDGNHRRIISFENQLLKHIVLKRNHDYELNVQFKKNKAFKHLRLIALWNPHTKKHVFLLTNTIHQQLSAQQVGRLYRLRWQIELLFKELKSYTELRRFLTANHRIAEGFIWAALCALAIRRFLVASAQKLLNKKLSFHKAAISARTFMPEFISCALHEFYRLKQCLQRIFEYIQRTMLFSNPRRSSALQLAGLLS